jgi:hypothetical protein
MVYHHRVCGHSTKLEFFFPIRNLIVSNHLVEAYFRVMLETCRISSLGSPWSVTTVSDGV